MRNGALTWMFIALGLLLAVPVHAADTVYYYSSDTIHSEVVVTDQNRNVVERTHYAPYGQVLDRDLRDGPGYTGHEEDPETTLVYMQQRYYDPEAGRFLSTDPVQVDGGGGSFNRYEYAKDNPYRYTDPDGRQEVDEGAEEVEELRNELNPVLRPISPAEMRAEAEYNKVLATLREQALEAANPKPVD